MDDLAVRSAGALSAPDQAAAQAGRQDAQPAAAQQAAPAPDAAAQAAPEQPAQRVEASAESAPADGNRGQLVDRFA